MSHLNGSSIARSRVVIIGSGWAGYTLTQQLNDSKYDITVISPHQTFQCTPLLASAATGLFFSRLAEEPIRSAHRHLTYYRALATAADFDNKTVTCIPSSLNPATGYDEPQPDALFDVQYDKLVIAPGCQNQTFGTPGAEHCFFLKSVADADAIRRKILSLVEEASLPNVLEARVRELLHFIVVGGGPTGIELSAELDDLTTELEKTYSHLRDKFSITVHDVAPEILGAFDRKLKEYAMGSLARHGMEVKTNSHIERVEKGAIHTKEEGRIGCGLVAWVTGNKQTDFVGGLAGLAKADKTHRVLTDQRLRVLKEDRTVIEDVFALGDMADILDKGLPATAEVALQKAEWLTHALNTDDWSAPFSYKQKSTVAYLGSSDGVVMGKRDWEGKTAWLAWRSGSIGWSRSWRRRILILSQWAWNYLGGREIARR